MSPVGRPDWQQVPRLFFARTVEQATVNVAANTVDTLRTYPAADLDDVVVIGVGSAGPLEVEINLIGGAGAPTEEIIRGSPAGGGGVTVFRVARGGNVTVQAANLDGAAQNVSYDVATYIGADASILRAPVASGGQIFTALAGGADSVDVELPNAPEFAELSVVGTLTQAFELRCDWTIVDPNPRAVATITEVLAVGAAAATAVASVPMRASHARVYLRNTAGVAGDGSFMVIARRLSAT